MGGKKASKGSKALGKKDMKKTKGGTINFASNQLPAVQRGINFNPDGGAQKVTPGQISICDGSV
ncbi:MAG TPA: hypothetical protein VE981_15815 [Planctomycetota bacterium]|nr:hypothetical protein [Planctomycetota bacterium]